MSVAVPGVAQPFGDMSKIMFSISIKYFGEKLYMRLYGFILWCMKMVRMSIRLPDDTDEKMRRLIVNLVGLKNFHGNLTRFISFAVDRLIEEIESGNEELKKQLLQVLRK